MEGFEYKGYIITLSDGGNFQVDDLEFPTFDEAMDWIDSLEDSPATPLAHNQLHTYLFFFVDNATDRSEQACIKAKNYNDAVDILYANYDVYHIADYDVLD